MDHEAEATRPAEPVTGAEDAADQQAVTETAPPAVESGKDGQQKPTWEELLQDPDYKSRYDAAVQGIVKARLRNRANAEEKLQRLAPVLAVLEERFGMTETGDAAALAERLREGAEGYRPKHEDVAAHLENLMREAELLRRTVPDFDLARELEDPDFVRMTAPHSGVSLADAYFARHRRERERETAQRSLEAVSRSLQSAGQRPRELRETGTGTRFAPNPAAMTRGEREDLKKRILQASAQGKHLGVGQ